VKSRKHDGPDDAAPVATPPQQEPREERGERGLAGVDAAPVPALTREEIEALRRERDELREQVLRKRAEFENYRKRVERDRQQAWTDAAAAIFKGLVPTLDNLDRALETGNSQDPLWEGMDLTRRELLGFLESQGVESHDPVGQPFDPEAHQALSHEPAAGFADGTVVEVFRKGYSYKGRLLRPALVKVAKGGQGGPEAVH
jgi:molecular chaperone GrpE